MPAFRGIKLLIATELGCRIVSANFSASASNRFSMDQHKLSEGSGR